MFRVTIPKEQVKDLKLYPKPDLVDRKTGRKESVLDDDLKTVISYEQLQEGLIKLNSKIEERYGSVGSKVHQERFVAGLPSDGFVCIDQHS